MNIQTVKARATPVRYGNGGYFWKVRHPYAAGTFLSDFPHDCAAHVIRSTVLPNSVARRTTPG
jgi:hypothetical protein